MLSFLLSELVSILKNPYFEQFCCSNILLIEYITNNTISQYIAGFMRINHSKPYFTSENIDALLEVLERRFVTAGEMNRELGSVAAAYLGKAYGIPTQSGTDALTAAFLAMELPEGASVGVPAYICSAPLDALALCRLKPVPIDIDLDNFAISVEAVNSRNDLSAVLAAHLFGRPAPFYNIECENTVEDCAQTLGLELNGVRVGSMAKFAVCSFYGTKMLTTGHGGLVALDDKMLYEKIIKLITHDKQETWQPHFHFQMSDLNAALGLSQFKQLDLMIEKRRAVVKRFYAALGEKNIDLSYSVYSRFILFSDKNIEVTLKEFNDAGIEAKRPVYRPLFQYLGYSPAEFPNAQWAHDHIISVPVYPAMEEEEIEFVEQYLEKHKNELCCRPSA